MNVNTQAATGKAARPGRGRFRWALALLGAATLPAASLLGASSASADSPNLTITVEYDATSVNAHGVIEPSVIFRGSGFRPLPGHVPPDVSDKVFSITRPADHAARSAYDGDSSLESKICTRTVSSYCFINYRAGELRPFRLFLGDSPPGNNRSNFVGRYPKCGDQLIAQVTDAGKRGLELDRYATAVLRIPCDTYVLKPPISVSP